MAQNWNSNVNTDFFNLTTFPEDNVIRIGYESGRESTCLKNSTPKKQHSFTLLLWNRTEELAFWDWYENTILSGTLSFILTNLLSRTGNKEYKMTSVPTVESGAYPKELTINVKEV